jgi:hypothetical protein
MLAFAITAAIPAAADTIITTTDQLVTFAQYDQVNGATQQWSVSTSGDKTTITASGSVQFSFSGPGLPFQGPELAALTLTASSTQTGSCGVSCGMGDSFDQFGYTGTFSFTDEGFDPGANLLSGTFEVTGSPSTTGAQFNSNMGSDGGGFDASATAGNLNQIVLTSAFLNFTNQTEEDASFSLSSLDPMFALGAVTGNQAYPAAGPFDASGAGTFASNPGPTDTMPEPSTSVLIGGGLLSLGLLRRRKPTRQ